MATALREEAQAERQVPGEAGLHRKFKVVALTEVNSHILELATESRSDATDWDFFCECGRPNCHQQVMLTVAAFNWLRSNDLPVIARGHKLSHVARARILGSESAASRAVGAGQASRQKGRPLELDAPVLCPPQ